METNKHQFNENMEWFVKNIESRKQLLPLFAHTAGMLTGSLSKKLNTLIENHGFDKTYDEKGNLKRFSVPEEYSKSYTILKRTKQHTHIFADLLPKMAIISLVSLFDAYLIRLIKTFFLIKPETLKGSQKQLTYAEISNFIDINDAKEYLINLEIETLLRESHCEQFIWLEKKLGIPLTKELEVWSDFIELTERRNLFVHTEGVVSKQYIQNCQNNGVKVITSIKAGDKLEITPEYYESACNCVAEIGIKLTQVMWRKLLPNESSEADKSLISVSYDFLFYQEYELALAVTKIADIKPIKILNFENKLFLKINQSIALKGLKKNAECSAIIESVDWSASADVYKLAIEVLKENWTNAHDIMISMGPNNKQIKKREYEEWPLFRWFRKTNEFRTAYKTLFKDEYKIVEIPD